MRAVNVLRMKDVLRREDNARPRSDFKYFVKRTRHVMHDKGG